jgi:hypothetical protein
LALVGVFVLALSGLASVATISGTITSHSTGAPVAYAQFTWGTKWGTVPHGVQPISAESDSTEAGEI